MARRFPSGVPGLLQALMWIQREAATGALAPAGGGTARIHFRDGIVLAAGDGPAAEDAPEELRERIQALMKSWGGAGTLALFTEGERPERTDPASGRINAGDLILDLVRRASAPGWVERQMAACRGKLSNPESLPRVLPRVAMTPTEAFLLSRADGTMTLKEILTVSPVEGSEVTRALYGLLAAGLLQAPGALLPGDRQPAEPADLPEEKAGAPGSSTPPGPSAAPQAGDATVPIPVQAAATPETHQAQGSDDTSDPAPLQRPAPGGPDPAGSPPDPGPAPAPKPTAEAVSALDDFLARTAQPAAGPRSATDDPPPPPAPPVESPPASGGASRAAPPAGGAAEEAGKEESTDARSPEMERLRAEVLEWIGKAAGADFYGILGVSSTAGESEIRRAYYKLAKKFHPDKFRRPEFQGLLEDVEKMFAVTTEAYNTLTDDRLRAEYEKERAAGTGKGSKGKEADLTAQARESYLRAKKHIEAEELFDAASLLETACRLDGTRPEYWLLLGSVQERNPKWRRKAEASYKKVLEINPTSADAYLHLARLYQAGGLHRRAMEMYKKVVEWDPQNEEAQAGLSGKSLSEASGVTGRIRSIFKGTRS